MYAYLKGQLISLKPDHAIIDIGGCGYYVHTPLTLYTKNKTLGEQIFLYTSFLLREDSMRLFGFETEEEKILFEKLIAISGVGPKIALLILSNKSRLDLSQIIAKRDIESLTKIPGIGKKTAERIVIELSDKIKSLTNMPSSLPIELDAIAALITLGYKEKEAAKSVELALKKIKPDTSLADLISLSLSGSK
jgi:Holliday junction DNA helicase RuvA